jgi:hypothetical protein
LERSMMPWTDRDRVKVRWKGKDDQGTVARLR